MFSKIDLFHSLSPAELDVVSASCVQRRYPRNSVIINDSDTADSMYIIASGRVKVYCAERNGKEYVVNTLGRGDYFGELALLDDNLRSASVRTIEQSSFLVLYREAFSGLVKDHPEVARALMHSLIQRVRQLTRAARSLALQDVYGRVAQLLTQLAVPGENGTARVPERLTQQDIADRVGASREMVARILKDLTIGHYIRWEERHIVLQTRLPRHY